MKGWAEDLRRNHPEVLQVGIFGSYARGDYTPASDVDVVAIVESSSTPVWKRALDYPPPPGPVGADVFVYTAAEVSSMERQGSPWIRRILDEALWLAVA
jgi:predicted nucleotidyltransferase